jgi:hypothetical protein
MLILCKVCIQQNASFKFKNGNLREMVSLLIIRTYGTVF